ncbi:MAG TPA: hypothetical protein VLC93_09520 [Myxococcota bacterium]|nr:hypothetical protein [Myxococcota bacterium]
MAIAVTAFAFSACNSSGDKSTLRVSLGDTLQALTVDSVSIDRFELTIVCVDGSRVTETGDIADDGTFEAEVPNCPQASVRFRGLTSAARPALHGVVEAAIRPPSTELSVPVRRVGTVSILNDDTYAAVCAISAPGSPELEGSFLLNPGASVEQVLPVNGVSLSCAPADTCGGVDTCDFSGPLATTRAVAVTFGGESTLSLANLSNSLVFTVGPPGPHNVGGVFGPFTVSLVDELGQPVTRSDVTVNLVAESPTIHGGFGNGSVVMANGSAQFNGVTFTTSGTLLMRAEADVDGVLLTTDTRNIQVIPGPNTHLLLTGPASTMAGIAFDVGIVGVDSFGNPTATPAGLIIDSTDSRTAAAVIAGFGGGTTPFTLFSAGTHTLTARSSADSGIFGVLTVDVVPSSTVRLDLSTTASNYIVGQNIVFRVIARDTWDNVAVGYRGTVSLNETPTGDFTYSGAHAFSAGDNGVFDFAAQFGTIGARVVVAGDGTFDSDPVNVTIADAGTLDHFEVILATLGVQAGENFDVTVRAVDAASNVATTFEGVVTVFSDGGCNGLFNIDYTMSGVLTQQIYCTLAGTWVIKADYAAAHFGQSAPLPVSAGSPYAISVVQQPPPAAIANQRFSVTVQLSDSYGNAADPRGTVVDVLLGDAPGRNLLGITPVYVGNLLTYPGLTIDGGTTGATISFQVNPPVLEVNGAGTSAVFINAGGCPTTYVQAGASGVDPCDFQNPVGSVQAALDAVNVGGEVHVAAGDYSGEAITITKTVKLLGGYESSFDPLQRDPQLYATTLKGPTAASSPGTIDIGVSAYAVVDGFIIEAADVVDGTSQEWAITISGSPGSTYAWIENNRLVGPVASFAIADGGVVDIGDVGQVVIRDNWIHTGGAAAGARSGIRGGFAPGNVSIVHNSIYVALSGTTEALYFGGNGTYTFTNNLVIGDFATCGIGVGVCAVREGEASFGVASIQHNYIGEQNAVPVDIYQTRTNAMFPSLNAPGGPQFSGNFNELGAVPDAIFASFGGPDDTSYAMADNDWHLFASAGFTMGIDATQPFCGPNHQQLCNGSPKDMDGDTRAVPACVGTDEYFFTGLD